MVTKQLAANIFSVGTLKVETADFSKTLVSICQMAWHLIPEDCTLSTAYFTSYFLILGGKQEGIEFTN
jgi:hypothetical protein